MTDTPRVWVGCLGCYNAGTLAGRWFDATEAPEEMEEFNKAIGFEPLEGWQHGPDAYSPEKPTLIVSVSDEHGDPVYGPHEELWVMDHENFGGFLTGECSPSESKRIATLMQAIEDAGFPVAAVAAWKANGNDVAEWDAPTEEAFQESYAGEHDTMFDFAWDFLEDTGFWQGVPEQILTHQSAIVHDWLSNVQNGGEIWTAHSPDHNYYVFWSR